MLSVSDLGQPYCDQRNNPTTLYDNPLALDSHLRCRMQTYGLSYVCSGSINLLLPYFYYVVSQH